MVRIILYEIGPNIAHLISESGPGICPTIFARRSKEAELALAPAEPRGFERTRREACREAQHKREAAVLPIIEDVLKRASHWKPFLLHTQGDFRARKRSGFQKASIRWSRSVWALR